MVERVMTDFFVTNWSRVVRDFMTRWVHDFAVLMSIPMAIVTVSGMFGVMVSVMMAVMSVMSMMTTVTSVMSMMTTMVSHMMSKTKFRSVFAALFSDFFAFLSGTFTFLG